ncbi:unnamed protein product [Thlaspi arvense]|uniref:Uncharacterized protein n=1 Tax=Thlaspi arvense TaxID=13288 RepID=A0AAU9RFK9_THLAR|nr:unnamed protein product [Thlaspi arvense]
MSEKRDAEQVLEGSESVEDATGSVGGENASANVGAGNGAEVADDTANQESSSTGGDRADYGNRAVMKRIDSIETTDGGKDDMFVDCSEELASSDNREATGFANQERSDGKEDMQGTFVHESENGMRVDELMDQLVHLRAMLEKTIGEKESSVQQCKEEKDAFIKELTDLLCQLKGLNAQQSLLNEHHSSLTERIHKADIGEVVERISFSDNPLHELINECSSFVGSALAEHSQIEGTVGELHSMLSMKDQEIEDLHVKFTELSMSQEVIVSFLSGAQESWCDSFKVFPEVLDEQRHIEATVNRVLSSLAMTINEEDLLDDSIMGKMSCVEKKMSLLVGKYNHILSEIDILKQCLTDLKGKEAELTQKISHLEDDNKKLLEQLEKGREMAEMANADVEKLRVELEQEKARYANTKEKLGMAVTKGKALVQQRDSLKQSLAEKTSELEKCLTELQEKSSALEASEMRREELVRTENLAMSLQEALSERDVIFTKCEEILSQIPAPQELWSADIPERIRWLVDERNTLMGVTVELNKVADALSLMDLPETVSSSNLESQVSWLVQSFSLAEGQTNELQDKISRITEAAQNGIEHLTTLFITETQEKHYIKEELEELAQKYKELEEEEYQASLEKEQMVNIQGKLEELTQKNTELVEKEYQASLEKEKIVNMLIELSGVTIDSKEEGYQPASEVEMLIDRCFSKVKEQCNASSKTSSVEPEMFEKIQTLLYISYEELMLCEELLDEEIFIRSKVNNLSDELRAVSQELQLVKDEKSVLEKDLERSEEKSALVREKLSMAVKKGKGLVQERENLKKLIDEKSSEIEKLNLDLQQLKTALGDCKEQIHKLSTNVELIPKLEADLETTKDSKDQLEGFLAESNGMLQKVIESIDSIVLPDGLTFNEPVEKAQWLVGHLSECQVAKNLVEQEVEKLRVQATSLSSKLAEAYTAKEASEKELAIAETNVSKLLEEKKELEVGKTYVEQELQKALEEATSQADKFAEVCETRRLLEDALSQGENKISILLNEKEDAQANRIAAETELEKLKEEITVQSTKLAEAYRTIKSLEDALFQVETNASLLAEENNNAQVGRTNLENEMKKLKEEADLQASKLADASTTIKSLQDALLKTQNNISELANEKKNAEEEISTLNTKLNACVEELAGTSGRLESSSAELSSHLKNLELLLRDETLLFSLTRSFETKIESLKDMDLLLKDIKDHFTEIGSETLQSYPIKKESSYLSKFSAGLNDLANIGMGNGDGRTEGNDSIESYFRQTMEAFRFRDKILADKLEGFSTSMDEFIVSILTKLQATRDVVIVQVQQMRSLKQEVGSLEMDRQEQENRIAVLENDVTVLLSACTGATQELENEVKNYLVELNFMPELEKSGSFSEVREVGVDADQHRLDSSKYFKITDDLFLAAKKVTALAKKFGDVRNVLATEIKDLEIKLAETRTMLEYATEEKDLNQNRVLRLESNLEALQNSYQEMKFKLEDYQAKEGKLHDREAEISLLQNSLLTKEREDEDSFLSPSQLKSLYDKINGIEVPFAELKVGDTEFQDSDIAKKLFYVIDAVALMRDQMNLLSHNNEELHSTLLKQVRDFERLKEEFKAQNREKEDSNKMKSELFEIRLGLENLVYRLPGNDFAEEQKSAGVMEVLPVLEKLVTSIILDCENSKSKAQELSVQLLESQKVVEELSTKVKLLEDSNKKSSPTLEGVQDRSMFEAPPLPPRSEITEVDDVGPIGKKAVASAPSAAHVRTLRKGSSNDHLAISIDSESDHLVNKEETDEDKGHVFKSLNTSGLIPRHGKMIADRIDGIW